VAVLVTGGAGFIGSHACVELQAAGHALVVLDNLCNSKADVISRVSQITGQPITFIEGDVRDAALLARVFRDHPIDAVIHFAGLKAVGESVEKPLDYFDNNVGGTLTLLRAMKAAGCRTLVFSSSATVYGEPHALPIREDFPLKATNPYGRSKLIIEDMLRDLHHSDPAWRIAILRYFNPVGAHESGLIGEDPNGIPNNLMPYIADVAEGKRECLLVFGNDYPTLDGTGVRDYIHVVDLALGHVKALQALQKNAGLITVNLGTGRGYSVLEMLVAFEAVLGRDIPYQIATRRDGDVSSCYADPSLAAQLLGWRALRGLAQMCQDAWGYRVAKRNPLESA
jgi:UDP-glucose 4-epimerase